MSARNGNISRHNRLRKKKIAKRLVTRALKESISAAAPSASAQKPSSEA